MSAMNSAQALLGSDCDYLIVGGGSAGAALAGRLSEDRTAASP